YLGGTCNNLRSQAIKVGGHQDHVHILCLLSKNIALATFMGKLTANSSKWMKTHGEAYRSFYWQNGYGAFSVKTSEVDVVINYIANQKEHHKRKTFQDEYRAFLDSNQMEYDERYVWD